MNIVTYEAIEDKKKILTRFCFAHFSAVPHV